MKDKKQKLLAGSMILSGHTVEQALAKLNEKYGDNTFTLASRVPSIRLIPTGCHAVDIALGGGFAQNRITELNGHYSSYKSTLSLSALANFQRRYPNGLGAYVDLEKSFERIHAKRLGVNLKRLAIIDPDSGEQAADALFDFMQMELPIFVILDSLAALRPTKESESTTEDQLKIMGVQAKLAGLVLTSMNMRLKRDKFRTDTPAMAVVLNQLREKIGIVFGNPEYTPGGAAKDYYYSVVLRLRLASQGIDNKIKIGGVEREITVGETVNFAVKKNKVGGPRREEGSFSFYFHDHDIFPAYSFDNVTPLVDHGVFHGLIDISATPKGTELFAYRGIKPCRMSDFRKSLAGDEEAADELYHAILAKVQLSAASK